jgi:hypothetical protein
MYVEIYELGPFFVECYIVDKRESAPLQVSRCWAVSHGQTTHHCEFWRFQFVMLFYQPPNGTICGSAENACIISSFCSVKGLTEQHEEMNLI